MTNVATQEDIARLEQQIISLQETIISLLSQEEKDEILTLAEAAELLKVSTRTMMRYVAADPALAFRPSGKAKGDMRFYRSKLLSLETRKKRPRGRRGNRVRII